MCGIAGAIFKQPIKNKSKLVDTLVDLTICTEVRGTHATGIVVINKVSNGLTTATPVSKMPLKASEYMPNQGRKFLNNFIDKNTWAVITHCRFGTHGSEQDNRNNHPIRVGNVVGVHNGVISNHHALGDKYGRNAEVDSEVIFSSLMARRDLNHQAFVQTMNELRGSAVVVAVQDKQPISKLYIGIKNNPMSLITQNDEEITWLASTKDILIKGLKGLDNADIDYENMCEMLNLTSREFTVDSVKLEWWKHSKKLLLERFSSFSGGSPNLLLDRQFIMRKPMPRPTYQLNTDYIEIDDQVLDLIDELEDEDEGQFYGGKQFKLNDDFFIN